MAHQHPFFSHLARVLNSQQARSLIVHGNVYDLFFDGESYQPLLPFLCAKCRVPGLNLIVYELNGPIRILDDPDGLRSAWIKWKTGVDRDTLMLRGLSSKRQAAELSQHEREFDQLLLDAIGNSTLALELMRQLTVCSRQSGYSRDLLILIEAADMLLPSGRGDVGHLTDTQLRRISVVQDWFGDPEFFTGRDAVCLIAESQELIHPRVSRMPQVLGVEVPSPSSEDRTHFVSTQFEELVPHPELWDSREALVEMSAGLTNHAMRQLLVGASYREQRIEPSVVIEKIEQHIQTQLGDDVVEFKKPEHRLSDVIGFTKLKGFLDSDVIPRFRAEGDAALAGAAVAGPIGSGKTFIFEAVAAELGMPVLVLKGLRSQWFGQTDVIFERLRRVIESLDRVLIFVDEADTQFGSVAGESHATERRLTGKIQAMMSNRKLRGKVFWLLMTARIHLLSPDLRRPGRVGDLIIPVLDPEGDDREAFLRWTIASVEREPSAETLKRLEEATKGYSSAAFAGLRSEIKAIQPETIEDVVAMVEDRLVPDITDVRRYQTLQALINCTRRSLLPDPDVDDVARAGWHQELRTLESRGVS